MNISDFNYQLPRNLIANSPADPRDSSRLMCIDRTTEKIKHKIFRDIASMLGSNDVLVLNKTKVFPARFYAQKESGGKVEVLLIEEIKKGGWTALTKPGLKIGQEVSFKGISFKAITENGVERTLVTKTDKIKLLKTLQEYGKTPLPPYIHSKDSETKLRSEYQTVYAKILGSVAAPTAGFHFTEKLLNKLMKKGVQIEYVTLHVGLGTFSPVKTKRLEDHPMHFEYFELEANTAESLNNAKKEGKRIVAVGTTSTRVLETCATKGFLKAQKGNTNLFIFPSYKFKFVDALITNFHLPKSTLLALVSAFVSYPNTKDEFKNFKSSLMGQAYHEAVKNKYRFFSFGDACFIF